jgi:hypothetical protein
VLLFSQNASRFFHAEDEIIGKELERLKIPSVMLTKAVRCNTTLGANGDI